MTYVRKDLWDLGKGWNDTILWYAKAVQELQKRPITDRTSWRYLGAIHGFDKELWVSHWAISEDETLPPEDEQAILWNQCQHQSWYFLPWHRGYLQAFENIVRDTIIALGGPSDWALPYWNYNEWVRKPQVLTLPKAFYVKTLPDGTDNPLAIPNLRFGVKDGVVALNPSKIDLKALKLPVFTGVSSGGDPGFGGPETGFNTDGNRLSNGGLESNPHNPVHVMVGGAKGENNEFEGLMSDPQTAGLDPIFWLHHANIDRLWQVWLNRDPAHSNPTDSDWVEGPPPATPINPTARQFEMPHVDGSIYQFHVSEMLDLEALGYTYQDLTAPRVLQQQAKVAAVKTEATAVADARVVELVGANAQQIKLLGSKIESPVRLDKPGIAKVSRNLNAQPRLSASNASTSPSAERVFLNLENIRGRLNATTLDIYVNLPDGSLPEEHPELRAGVIALFGVRVASRVDAGHAGAGLSETLDITDIIERLSANGAVDLEHLNISLFANYDLKPENAITIGRISVYRQGK